MPHLEIGYQNTKTTFTQLELSSLLLLNDSHFGLSCPVAMQTLGVDISSCRADVTMVLTYSCFSWSQEVEIAHILRTAYRSLPMLTVIVSPLFGRLLALLQCMFFRRSVECETGASIPREGSGARKWDQRHRANYIVRWYQLLVDCWLIVSIVRSRCWLIVDW